MSLIRRRRRFLMAAALSGACAFAMGTLLVDRFGQRPSNGNADAIVVLGALVLPGGQINPDLLRANEEALKLIKSFVDSGKVVAAICHAPWLLVEIDAVRGRQVTSYHSIKTDVKNAGGRWVDKEVVTDRGIITSRKPDDLNAFVAKIIEEVQEGTHQRQRVAG